MVGAEGAELRRGLGLAAQAPVQTLYRCCQTWSFKPKPSAFFRPPHWAAVDTPEPLEGQGRPAQMEVLLRSAQNVLKTGPTFSSALLMSSSRQSLKHGSEKDEEH